MQTKTFRAALIKAGIAASVLLLGSGAALAQQQVNLTAGPSSLALPDGSVVPMWGYTCTVPTGSTATCKALNPNATGWSPVVITVPSGQDLVINLTNNLANTASPTAFASGVSIPTSLTIVGQLGGGLGGLPSRVASPPHAPLGVSWALTGTPTTGPVVAPDTASPTFTPPTQGPRVQSFGTEVAAAGTTAGSNQCASPCALTWTAPTPGTYLLESGTHPSIQAPMGLIGMVVVTNAPGTVPPTGCNPAITTAGALGTAYCANGSIPAVTYNADVDVLMSEIDPVQNTAVNAAVNTVGFSETMVWSGLPGFCGNPSSPNYQQCYPPAVNYSPLYYLINGIAFDKTHAGRSQFPVTLPAIGGGSITSDSILVRLVNAGLKMHVPSIVGAVTGSTPVPGFALVAEDGNPLPPANPRVQSEVFMAAGKTYDVMITPTGGVTTITLTAGGAGYNSTFANPPTTQVNLSGGGGSGATGIVVSVTYSLVPASVTVSGGTCYSVNDVLSLGNGSATATVTATDGLCTTIVGAGGVTSISGTSGTTATAGAGYTVTTNGSGNTAGSVSGGTGSGATFTATLDPTSGSIAAVGVPSGGSGSGYTAPPMVSFTDATGTNANANATIGLTGTLPVFDRELSLSANAINHDAGMLAYISLNGTSLPATASFATAVARNDTYASLLAGQPLTVSDPSKGVIANDTNVSGVVLLKGPTNGTVALNHNGTFSYTPSGTATSDSFTYCANGTVTGGTCSSGKTATVTLGAASLEAPSGISVGNVTYTSTVGCPSTGCPTGNPAVLSIKPSGVLSTLWTGCTPTTANPCHDGDAAGYPLTVVMTGANAPAASTGLTLSMDSNGDGGFKASVTTPGSYTFTYYAQNSQGVISSAAATVTVVFPTSTGLQVTVTDPVTNATVTDYRWVIEEDQTFYINPACTTNNGNGTGATTPPASCPQSGIVPTLGVNFHTSHMPFVAQGCTGTLSCEGGQMVYDPHSGNHIPAVCDVGNGVCRPDPNAGTPNAGFAQMLPSQVYLDPTKRYYISVLPGDAAYPFVSAFGSSPSCNKDSSGHIIPSSSCGHGMGGAPITIDPNTGIQSASVNILTQPAPYPPAKLSVFVFEDDFPLNGEHDGGGGVDVLSPNEPGLGGFQIHLWDAMAGNGDFTGQMTYDMFNQPLTNSLDGTIDPATGLNACPITNVGIANPGTNASDGPATVDASGNPITSQTAGITGMIVTCPKYEADNATLSPLAGQAVVSNLMPMRMGVIATPAAERIARGEEWLQTNTLDGQKAHDAFVRIGEPSFFQEFGPASYHVSIGFANPAIINARRPFVCNGTDPNITGVNCQNTIVGRVVGERLSRTPDERLYGSGSHDAFAWTQCFVSVGDPDGEDFAFTKCDADGRFTLNGLPDGQWRVTTFDQWNDQLVDGLSTPVGLGAIYPGTPGSTTKNPVPANTGPSNCPGSATTKNPTKGSPMTCDMGDIAATQWETNMNTVTFVDDSKDGVHQLGEGGIPFANVAIRLRDGSLENLQVTDFTGTANFNETFPLFSWYTVETDTTRYKNTGTHVVYDVGGPADQSLTTCGGTQPGAGFPPCGTSTIAKFLANTAEQVSVPAGNAVGSPNLRVPGSVYCGGTATADCVGKSIQNLAGSDAPSVCSTNATTGQTTCSTQLTSGRIDNPWYGAVEGWQGFPGQFSFLEFGKEPYAAGENGGIKGHVVYASTRPFDDPTMLVQTQWTPLIPNVTMNLYQEGVAADGVTPTLTLVDTTQTTSWDAWAQGFHKDANGNTVPNMNCPGQGNASGVDADLFFFSLFNQPQYLDLYAQQHATAGLINMSATGTPLPYNSQFKCYDGMHNWNQVQPAPYDGMYQFPSITSIDPATGKPNGTNCKICSPNNAVLTTDLYYGLPMLPKGKYVVEVVVPPGYELVKEEDKNILIGDNYIAPVVQQIGGIGNVFIMPDQASVAQVNGPYANTYAGLGYNANNSNLNGNNNGMNQTVSLGASPQNSIVPSFIPEPVWPCVGAMRIVPDYISLYPYSSQVSPFAGASRPLCDRKEVTLGDQMGAIAKFYLFSSVHIASKFTGGITDDYTSEFDPFSPQFGEKFSPPDLPVSVRDWSGTETNRVYADHWGAYNGMTYSSWEVNPPNPTGYAPSMMVFCMNDPGPILDTRGNASTNPTFGQMITDPLFTPGYSQFCYELPFMPGTTQYLDTPVVPTSAFAGAGYNNVDCNYPTLTPAIRSVVNTATESNGTGSLAAGSGPWVSDALHSITITALGDTWVPNNAYSGPSATAAPFNQKTVLRHYGFGNAAGKVTIGGLVAPLVGTWSDTVLTVQVPNGLGPCPIDQQSIYGGAPAQCGELVITAATGQQSVDSVNVTVGGKAPTVVASNTPLQPNAPGSIQAAIDAAAPGDMIIVPAGTYYEMVLMWKPVRLQGVGGASSIIDASTHPAGKMDHWRAQVDCLFGLAMNGQPVGVQNGPAPAPNAFDATGRFNCPMTDGPNPWANYVGPSTVNGFDPSHPQVDRMPFEAVLGWDASLNGNMAELLQEPSLMGALEGAAITVLSKGVDFHGQNPYDPTLNAGFPTQTTFLDGSVQSCLSGTGLNQVNPNPSNFWCNPSSIDGLGIQESSQGGGGIFVHAYGHNLQIANNRINDNAGTMSGGINIGQGEFAPSNIFGSTTNTAPGSCDNTGVMNGGVPYVAGQQQPYCQNVNVNIHNNYLALNSSTGDELFSATPAGAGGVSICTGADNYKFNYNWVCGNLSSGDGGGFGHIGFSFNGDIEHNTFIFNQSLNPTIPANGGGLIIMGSPDADPTCGATTDQDCVSPAGALGPSDGIGPGLKINANLIMGNAAEAGTGGGVAFQSVNGSEVVAFPTKPQYWYQVQFTNNIVTNNVAGWDGGGISLADALNVNIVNNTIASNVTTATAGVLFNTLGAPLASQQNTGSNNCFNAVTGVSTCGNSSAPQPAGLVSIPNSAVLSANLPTTIDCPARHGGGTSLTATVANGLCRSISYPLLADNVMWQNTAYLVGVGATPNTLYQQNVVTLYNPNSGFTGPGTVVGTQASTGACLPGTMSWDLGVRGDTSPSGGSTYRLAPIYSVITNGNTLGYTGTGNVFTNPQFVSQYCDGSRQPPEFGQSGFAVPPGISDATVPNPLFNLTPVATVDEGNNWVNLRWGPLTMVNPVTNEVLGNYALQPDAGNAAVDHIPVNATTMPVPALQAFDFFGNARPDEGTFGNFDIGAIEAQATATVTAATLTSISPSSGVRGTTVAVTINGTDLTGATAVNVSGAGVTRTITSTSPTAVTANFVIAATAAAGARTVTVTTPAGTTNAVTFTVVSPTLTSINPASAVRSATAATTVAVTLTGTNLTGNATGYPTVNVSGTGVTVNTIAVNPAGTQLTANFVIATTATLSTRTVSVTTSAGVTSNTVNFAVTPPTPTIASITPASGAIATTQAVTITGTNLSGTGAGFPTVNAGTGVTVNAIAVNAAGTQLTANFVIARTAALGARTVTVTTATGVSATTTFTVTGATLAFSTPSPSLVTGTTTAHSGTVTVTNTATGANAGPFTLTGPPVVTKVGTAGGSFAIVTTGAFAGTCVLGSTIAPGASCTVGVQYTPGSAGTTTATANVTVNGNGTNPAGNTGANFTAN